MGWGRCHQGVAGFWQAAVASTVVASVLFGAYLQVVSRATAPPAG